MEKMNHINIDGIEEIKLENDKPQQSSLDPIPTSSSSNQDESGLMQSPYDPLKSNNKAQFKSDSWSTGYVEYPESAADAATSMPPRDNNPYVNASSPSHSHSQSQSQSTSATVKNTVSTVKDVLGKWGKKVGETTKQAEVLAGNVWQHLKTGPSFADAAMGRIAQGTKVIAEGGYEKIFRQTFETVSEEQLQRTYACYLSTSAGPVMGILYISTAKLAFCSDNPLPYKVGEQNEWSYYKVVIPLHQLKAVNPSISQVNRAEKYIQVISVDDHEFWFMGFVNYDSAGKYLQDALQARFLQSVA